MRIGRINTENGAQHCHVGEDYVCLLEGDIYSDSHEIGPRRPIEGVEFLIPVQPTKILVVLGAFPGDRTLDEARQKPPKFAAKLTSSMIANHMTVVIPEWVNGEIYVEPEIAVVIGKTLKDASPEAASAGILGFTSFNDVTLLDAIRHESDYLKAKSLDTFGAIGSWITTDLTPEALEDGLSLRAVVNDEVVHEGNTKLFTHSVLETISAASHLCSLFPGDIISLGTPPGPAPVRRGDRVRIEVQSVGNVVSDVK